MISQVKFCTIAVTDQQRSLEFYTQKLGFTVKRDESFDMGPRKMRWLELWVTPDNPAQTYVVLFTAHGHESLIGQFQPLVFSTDDVQKTYEELQARGVEFTQPPKQESWGWSSMFKDLDGNIFHLGSNS